MLFKGSEFDAGYEFLNKKLFNFTDADALNFGKRFSKLFSLKTAK